MPAHFSSAAAAAALVLPMLGATPPEPEPIDTGPRAGHTLLDPTPRYLRRPMSTDRPDVTESPYTVDAGAVQIEMSVAEFAVRNDAGQRTRSLTVAPFNLKLGLLDNTDVQLVLDPYVREDPDPGAAVSGVGDVALRVKVNLWGNDAGDSALAVMPFIAFPTGDDEVSAGHLQGGLIVPFSFEGPTGWSVGFIAEVDFIHDQDDDPRTEFIHTAALGHDLVGNLAGFIEYVGAAPIGSDADYRALLSMGLTYALSPDAHLDSGIRFGLTEADTDDLLLFVGLSLRF